TLRGCLFLRQEREKSQKESQGHVMLTRPRPPGMQVKARLRNPEAGRPSRATPACEESRPREEACGGPRCGGTCPPFRGCPCRGSKAESGEARPGSRSVPDASG